MLFIVRMRGDVDAAGCYPAIAQAIVDKRAHYVICAKANQPDLLTGVEQSLPRTRRPIAGRIPCVDAPIWCLPFGHDVPPPTCSRFVR